MTLPGTEWVGLGEVTPIVLARCAVGALVASHCESPIEVIFGVAVLFCHPEVQFIRSQNDPRDLSRPSLVPQFRWMSYRIDWALLKPAAKAPSVFVECDGAEFHSTDEQRARDRRKDAEAERAKIHMMRFSGSEIHRSYDSCAQLAMAALARCP